MATLTIQPSAKDTHLREDEATANFGTLTFIRVYNRSGRSNRSILEFDLSGLPSGAVISSATLELFYHDYPVYTNPVGLTVWAYKLSRTDWVEAEATWNIYKTGSDWTAAGSDYVTSSPAGGSTVFPASEEEWISFDVLAIVQDAQDANANAEFLVKFETEGLASDYSLAQLVSNDHAHTSWRPKLTIIYGGTSSPTVTTQAVTDIEQTTATGNGTIASLGSAAVTQHGHCWAVSENPTTSDSLTEKGAGSLGTFISLMTGLTANQAYHIRAYATNSLGTSYGTDVTFTASVTGTPIVTTEICTDMATTTATGNGTITSTGASVVTQHGHCWATSLSPTIQGGANYGDATTNGFGYYGAFTSAVTGLTDGTTYYVRAYATNTQGTAYGGNIILVAGGVSNEASGVIAVVRERLHYVSASGIEYYIWGEPV